jgi:hypothetical protein
MPLTQLIHITAAYSNAVLVAVLPHVNDYAKKLDLPIPLPITQSEVAKFNVGHLQGFVEGSLWLTNHYQFFFGDGYVVWFKVFTNNPWLSDDPANEWPSYVGKINMTTNDAVAFARGELVKLGYDPAILHCDREPTSFEGGCNLNYGPFPYCQIEWRNEPLTIEDKTNAAYVTVQINMKDKSLLGLSVISPRVWKQNPKIDVVPELESDYKKRTRGTMIINTNAPQVLNPNMGAETPKIMRSP